MSTIVGLRRSTVLEVIGLAIIAGNLGRTLWQDIQSAPRIKTRVCMADHYNIQQGCSQDDPIMSLPQAGQAYVVTNSPGRTGGVSDYKIVQDNADGTTTDISTWSTDVSQAPRYVVELATLWGEKIQPGTYDVVTDGSGGTSLHTKLTIYRPPKPNRRSRANTLTPTATPRPMGTARANAGAQR